MDVVRPSSKTPSLHVVGIDVLDDVLEAGRARVVERGLADRVVLRRHEIGVQLYISANTAANQVRSILTKTGTTNRTQAARYATDHPLT